jgi:hypothetical protein
MQERDLKHLRKTGQWLGMSLVSTLTEDELVEFKLKHLGT